METILVSIVCMALIVVSTVTMTASTFQSANKLAESWKAMERLTSDIRRTEIDVIPPVDYHGGIMDLTVVNEGQVNLQDFANWDVIVQYPSGAGQYLAFAHDWPPGELDWAIRAIYTSDGDAEVFDPGILNPGEKAVVSLNLIPELAAGETCKLTVATGNGVISQCQVHRPPSE